MLVFVERRKPRTGEIPSEQGENQQQTQPTYEHRARMETGSHVQGWDASVFTTKPPHESLVFKNRPCVLLIKYLRLTYIRGLTFNRENKVEVALTFHQVQLA